MHDQVDKWLAGDWLFLGMHVPHWLIALAAISLVALLVVWFERPQRPPARSSWRSRTSAYPEASAPR
jgi:quercetin dioxygenase-like cupin family protein